MTEAIRREFEALWGQIVQDFVAAVPKVVVGLVLVLLAYLAAHFAARATRYLVARSGLERLLAHADADEWMARVGTQHRAADLIARVVFWLLLLLFARTGADALGLTAISDAIRSIVGYAPELAGAVVILLVGAVLAKAAGSAVTRLAEQTRIQYGKALGRLTSTAVVAIVIVMAADQLRIDTVMVQLTAGALLGAVALGAAFAFGLGARDLTRSIMAGHYARKLLALGEEIRIGELTGTLVGVTPTHLLVERDGRVIGVANGRILEAEIEQPDATPM